MIRDIYIERNEYGEIISIGFSMTFCEIIRKDTSVVKELLNKIEIIPNTKERNKK